jgi:hypothetical protein
MFVTCKPAHIPCTSCCTGLRTFLSWGLHTGYRLKATWAVLRTEGFPIHYWLQNDYGLIKLQLHDTLVLCWDFNDSLVSHHEPPGSIGGRYRIRDGRLLWIGR